MSGGGRQDAADTKPVSEDDTPQAAAEIQALAEQAEADAAAAEALAAAARARSRAIHLRRQAERAKAQSGETAQKDTAQTDEAKAEEAATDSAQTEITDTGEAEPDGIETDDAPNAATPASAGDTVADTADVEAEERTRRRPWFRRVRRPKWSTLAACLAIIVSLAALAGSAYVIKGHRDAARRQQLAAEFAAAARQGVVTLTSLDFHDAKQGVQRILDGATGSYKDDFLKTADDFIKVVEQSKVVSQGTVEVTGVDYGTMTNDSAVVLVASTQEVTNVAAVKQNPRNYRLIVTVSRDRGQLKISKIDFVP